jgi:hypothetical protein
LFFQYPQAAWIADGDHPIFDPHVRQWSLKTGLIEFCHLVVGAHGQPGDTGGDDKPGAFQVSQRRGEDFPFTFWTLSQAENFLAG